ncbi:MAG TPA: DUF4942 domain-containing protein [Desulfuromonadales bacterium]|nr:DUF4942 domain-containing protein [Desulfuromonadales bacterium]
MTPLTTDIAVRETLPTMIATYTQATKEIEEAYQTLETAQKRLRDVFLDKPGYSFSTNDRNISEVGKIASDSINKAIKVDAWSTIVERMELRRLLSIKRRDELNKQIRDGELPELTEANVLALFETSAANVQTYLTEQVQEVFEWLRPHNSQHKTNTEFELGKKVVLTWMVETGYSRGKFRVNYHRDKYITALDNVFAMIDGKPPVKTYHGELYDAITDSPDGNGKTQYFKFKCYLNGNLHLEFLRADLVVKLNAVAGGNRLKN